MDRILLDEKTGERFKAIPYDELYGYHQLIEIKPEPKVIDWSAVSAEANIPARFWGNNNKLMSFFGGFNGQLYEKNGDYWKKCNLVTGIPVPWFGGSCPLPEGVFIKAWGRDGTIAEGEAKKFFWNLRPELTGIEIIAFQITGLKDGYIWNKGE